MPLEVLSIRSQEVLIEIKPPEGKQNYYSSVEYYYYELHSYPIKKSEIKTIPSTEFPDNKFMVKGLLPSTNYRINFTLFIPGYLWGNYKEEGFNDLQTLPLHQSFEFFKNKEAQIQSLRKELNEYDLQRMPVNSPVNRINILFLGKLGAGKSSCVQTIYSALTGSHQVISRAYDLSKSVTENLILHKLTNQINLYDLFGESDKAYDQFLGKLLGGELDYKHLKLKKNDDVTEQFRVEKKEIRALPLEESLMSAILVIDYKDSFNKSATEKLKSSILKASQNGFSIIVCLTKIEESESIEKPISKLGYYDHSEFVSQVDKLTNNLGVPADRIFPISNSYGRELRDEYKIKMALDVLRAALRHSPTRINFYHSLIDQVDVKLEEKK